MTGVRAWWVGLTLRERRLIWVMLALLAAVVLWLGIVLPVRDALARANADHLIAIDRAGRIEAAAAAVASAKSTPPPKLEAALDQVVGQSAGEAGFTLESSSPVGPDRVAIAIGQARPPALFAWLAALEARGVVVETITIQPGANGTVGARILLKVAAS